MSTLAEIKQSVMETLKGGAPSMHQNELVFRAAVTLFAILEVGFDMDKVCAFTGYKKSGAVRGIFRRLEKYRIFVPDGDRVLCPDLDSWTDPKMGHMAFMLDAMVAAGRLERRKVNDADQNPKYGLPGQLSRRHGKSSTVNHSGKDSHEPSRTPELGPPSNGVATEVPDREGGTQAEPC